MVKANKIQSFHLYPDFEIEGYRQTIKLGSIKNIKHGSRFSSMVSPCYPIFVSQIDNEFKLLNEHDRKVMAFLNHYSFDTSIEVIVIRKPHTKLVKLFTDKIFPFITSSLSLKEAILEVISNSEYMQLISNKLDIKKSKSGAKLPFNVEEFHSLFGNQIVSLSSFKRWIRKDDISVIAPTQNNYYESSAKHPKDEVAYASSNNEELSEVVGLKSLYTEPETTSLYGEDKQVERELLSKDIKEKEQFQASEEYSNKTPTLESKHGTSTAQTESSNQKYINELSKVIVPESLFTETETTSLYGEGKQVEHELLSKAIKEEEQFQASEEYSKLTPNLNSKHDTPTTQTESSNQPPNELLAAERSRLIKTIDNDPRIRDIWDSHASIEIKYENIRSNFDSLKTVFIQKFVHNTLTLIPDSKEFAQFVKKFEFHFNEQTKPKDSN